LSETDTIEYDLYYIKQGSLWMDVEILVNALVGGRKSRVSQRPAVALNTGHGFG
jgi:lipopolysaccharide/colanic/teichoic acid biosynthesis glycosyltransferase